MSTFIQWCQTSALSAAIRSNKWTYPSIEILHIAGLVLVFGSILVLNLRIFGWMLQRTPLPEVTRGLAPLTMAGLFAQAISGPLLFTASAVRFSESGPFRVKLVLLVLALIYHYAVHRPLILKSEESSPQVRSSAVASLITWVGVVLAGLGIELLAA